MANVGVSGCPAATVHEPGAPKQHGPADPERLLVHQPLQHRPRAEQRHGALALCAAQLHLRRPLTVARHPLQHRLPGPTQLRCVLPAVEHRQVRDVDGKSTGAPVPLNLTPRPVGCLRHRPGSLLHQSLELHIECWKCSPCPLRIFWFGIFHTEPEREKVPFSRKSPDLETKGLCSGNSS